MALIYGIHAEHQSSADDRPHILSFATGRTTGDDTLLQIWNGSTVSEIKAAVDLDGKYYSAALTTGDILYAVTGGISDVLRLDSLVIGTAKQFCVVNAGATAPEWKSLDATYVAAGTFPSGAFVFQGDVSISSGNTLGVGVAADTYRGVNVLFDLAGSSTARAGIYFDSAITGTGSSGSLRGLDLHLYDESTGSQTGSIIGAKIAIQGTSSGTSSAFNALETDIYVAPSHSTDLITQINIVGAYGGGTVLTEYGLLIGNITAGSTSNYAIYTNAGLIHFGDALTGLTVDATSLVDIEVNGTAILQMVKVWGLNTADSNGNNLSCMSATPVWVNTVGYTNVTVKAFQVSPQYGNSGSSSFNLGIGLYVSGGGGGGTPTVTTLRCVQIDQSAVPTITTQTGLWIGAMTGGSTNYAIYTGTGLVRFGDSVEIDGDLNHDGSNLGVFGTAPTTKQEVTGSRGANAALASLLTALAAYGLLTDSSS